MFNKYPKITKKDLEIELLRQEVRKLKEHRNALANEYDIQRTVIEKLEKENKELKEFINDLAKLTGINECDDWSYSTLYDEIKDLVEEYNE